MQNVDNVEMWAAEEAEEAVWTHFQIWATSSRQQPAAGRDIYLPGVSTLMLILARRGREPQ